VLALVLASPLYIWGWCGEQKKIRVRELSEAAPCPKADGEPSKERGFSAAMI